VKFREYHLQQILESFSFTLPLDVHLTRYFRAHRALGSKDRKFLSEAIYAQMRSSRPADFTGPVVLEASCPTPLYDLLVSTYGTETTLSLCRCFCERAPTTIRVNPLKTTREALLKLWDKTYRISPCRRSLLGIIFEEKINFAELAEFKNGLFEVQDEGSQLIAGLVEVKPGQHALDYCAGAGGKALAFGPKMANRGQLYLHDIRPQALKEARKRCGRAGIQNVQFGIRSVPPKVMDWILADVPCTGSGTYRRNPDLKWKFNSGLIDRLVKEQRSIFEEALSYLKPSGKIVYSTCSIFPQENQCQAAYFSTQFGLHVIQELQILPGEDGMDGFYGAVFSFS